jgi:hypothetical protein
MNLSHFVEEKRFSKDAGFVYESFQNETKRTFLTFFSYKTNPRNGYLKKMSTNPNYDTGNLQLSLRNESTKRIFRTP